MIGGDHQAAGIGDGVANLSQAQIGSFQHSGHPLPLRIQRGAPGLRRDVFGIALAETGLHLFAHFGAPAHFARIRHKDDRAHNTVGEGVAVAVVVVGLGEPDALFIADIRHKGNGGSVGTEGCSGQRESAGGGLEGLADRVTPAERVAAVVDLVEDHQRARRLDHGAVVGRFHRDLGVGDGDAVIATSTESLVIFELGVEPDTDPVGGVGPLLFEVLGGCNNDELVDLATRDEFCREAERKRRFTGTRGGSGEEVAGLLLEVEVEGFCLPGTKLGGGTAGGALRVRRREMLRRKGSDCRAGQRRSIHLRRHYPPRLTLRADPDFPGR